MAYFYLSDSPEEFFTPHHEWWRKHFDPAQKVVLYSQTDEDNTITILNYYETVSAANAAAEAAIASGLAPHVAINYSHSSVTLARSSARNPSRDATVEFPSFFDEAPRY